MEGQTPPQPAQRRSLKPLYWIAAVAMAVSAAMSVVEDRDWMAAIGRASLVIALILLATARPEETRAKKIAIYALVVISVGLFVTRLMRP